MGFTLVKFAGYVLQHIGGLLVLCWRRMMWAALVCGLVALLLGEITSSLVTQQVLAPVPAQIAVALFAASLGYGAAVTIFLSEMVAGFIGTVRLLEGEAEASVRSAAIIAERAEGELSGFVGWVDARAVAVLARVRGRDNARPPVAVPTGDPQGGRSIAAQPPLEYQRRRPASPTTAARTETDDDIAATEEFINTAPRRKVNAQPVPADQLPRIEWAYERAMRQENAHILPDVSQQPATQASTDKPSDDATANAHDRPSSPPANTAATAAPGFFIVTSGAAAASSDTSQSEEASPTLEVPMPSEAPPQTRSARSRITAPLSPDDSDGYWHPPSPLPVVQREPIARSGASRQTLPLPETEAERNSIWARISRALAGTSAPADASEPVDASESSDSAERFPDQQE